MKEQKIFDLNIKTVGGIHCTWAPDFRPEELDSLNYPRLGTRDLVIKLGVDVFLSTNVVNYLTGSARFAPRSASIGRINLFRWDKNLAEDALRQAAYPDRSDRETWVSERNFAIIAWIENLAKS